MRGGLTTSPLVPAAMACVAMALASGAWAAAPAPGVSAAQVGQIIAGLLAVLAAFAAAVIVLRRLPLVRIARNGRLKIVESAALGTRDRLLLIEVEGIRLLLGVTPGHIACLHVLNPAPAVQPAFAQHLQQVLNAPSPSAQVDG